MKLWVEAVGPTPARHEIGFVGFEDGGHLLDVLLGGDAGADENEVGGDPGEVERGERAEEVTAVDGAKAVGEDEVVDDAGPEGVGHVEDLGLHGGESLDAEEGVWGEDEGPDLVEVGVGELEGLEHGRDLGETFGEPGGMGEGAGRAHAAGALPEVGLRVDIGEEGAGDLGQDGVEVGCDGLGEGAGADFDLGDGVVGDGGLGDGPDEGIVLSGCGKSLRYGSETLCHAQGESKVDGEGEARAHAEEGTGDGVEDSGVDEAFAGAEVVSGHGEISGSRCGGEGANGLGGEGLRLGAEEEAGAGAVLLRELEGVEIVGGGEDPGVGGGGRGGIRQELERTAGGELRRVVGCGDEDGLVGEGEGKVGEGSLKRVVGEGGEADEEAAGDGSGRLVGGVYVGLSGGHRSVGTFWEHG